MEERTGRRRGFRFGVFELDVESRELFKMGAGIKLQDQPLQILALLLDNAGQVVSREELGRKLWPSGTFVEFDSSLATAVKKLRQALGDDAESPLYVQTLPKRGYRFIAPVEKFGWADAAGESLEQKKDPLAFAPKWGVAVALLVVALVGAGGLYLLRTKKQEHAATVLESSAVPLTSYPGFELQPTFSPDGSQVAFYWDGNQRNNFDIYSSLPEPEIHCV